MSSLLQQCTTDIQQTIKDKISGLKLGAQKFTVNVNLHYYRNSFTVKRIFYFLLVKDATVKKTLNRLTVNYCIQGKL